MTIDWLDTVLKFSELAGFVVLVILFLKYIEKRDEDYISYVRERDGDLKDLHTGAMGVLKETTIAIKDLEKQIQVLTAKIDNTGSCVISNS